MSNTTVDATVNNTYYPTMTTPNRLPASDRKQQILSTALHLAESHGYSNVTRQHVADALNLAPGLISHYFGTMESLRYALMQEAVRGEVLRVIAQGVVAKHAVAMRAPKVLRARALAACAPTA